MSKSNLYQIPILLFFLLFNIDVTAQYFKVGLLTGGCFSQVDGDSYAGYHKAGFVLGASVAHDWNTKWQSKFELEFKQKGAKKEPNTKEEDYVSYYSKLSYIEIPLIIAYQFKYVNLEGGLGYAQLIKAEEGDNYGEFPSDSNPYNSSEFFYLAGVNIKFTKKWSLNSRFSYSLVPIREPYEGEGYVNPYIRDAGQYNNSISVTINYILN